MITSPMHPMKHITAVFGDIFSGNEWYDKFITLHYQFVSAALEKQSQLYYMGVI